MGWKRYRRKIKRQIKRSGQQASDAWDRYKDTIIPVTTAIIGGALGSVVPGVGTAWGAALGYSLGQGGVSAYQSNKAENEAERQMKVMEGGLGNTYERRRMRRAGGDAVVDYDSNVPTAGAA